MYLYCEGKIASSVQAEPFADADGKEVIYHENVVITEDGVLNINSKESFKGVTDTTGVIKLRCRQLYNENGSIKGHKLTLAAFNAGLEIPKETQEEDIQIN